MQSELILQDFQQASSIFKTGLNIYLMNNRNMRLLERRAILSKTSLEIFGNNLFNNVIALEGDMDNFAATIHEAHQELMQKIHELPCILVNSQTSDQGTLLNPTTIKQHGYPLPLTEPNPRNREELLNFTVSQCIASAESLGLPSLPQDTPFFATGYSCSRATRTDCWTTWGVFD